MIDIIIVSIAAIVIVVVVVLHCVVSCFDMNRKTREVLPNIDNHIDDVILTVRCIVDDYADNNSVVVSNIVNKLKRSLERGGLIEQQNKQASNHP